MAAGEPHTAPKGEDAPVCARRKRTILVIEDEWLVRHDIADTLRADGWDVLETATAEGAMVLLQAGPAIDVVFTDIQLGGCLSGWDVAEAFRAKQTDMPVIYASGNSIDRSRQVPGSLFFSKPYQNAAILHACRLLA